MKIIAFSFAGGNKYSFQKFLDCSNDFTVLEYPGRGLKINENILLNIEDLLDHMVPKVIDEINSCDEYIIYGHSMGALIGYLICKKIEELGLSKPIKLIVSGKKPPAIKREKKIAHLDNNLFWDEVVKLGGMPEEFLNYQELIEYYTPILKADFSIIENYQYIEKNKLTIPIDVFYGSEENITEQEIKGWQDETTDIVTIKKLEGNHFFIFKQVDFFSNYFKELT